MVTKTPAQTNEPPSGHDEGGVSSRTSFEKPVEEALEKNGVTRAIHGTSELSRAQKSTIKSIKMSAKLTFMKEFGRRCRRARERVDMDALDAANILGVHRNTIANIEKGESLPDAYDLSVLARMYEISVQELLYGEETNLPSARDVEKSIRSVEQGDYIFVPEFDIHVSAGNGFFNHVEAVVAMRPFSAPYIKLELGITHNEMALIKVVGQSMEPDLRSRDTVLVDLRDRDVITDGIHILRLDGALLIKKVQRLPGRVLRVSSSNLAFEAFDIKGADEDGRDFEVLGRVRWAGVTFS